MNASQDVAMSDLSLVSQPAATPRKRRWGRRLGVIALVLLVPLGVLAWAAPGLIARSSYKDRLIADAAKDLNGRVEVGAVSLAWFHPVVLHDVTVTDADGRKALTAAAVSTSKTLLDLALNRNDLGSITVEKPRVELVVKGGTTNVEQILANYLKDDTLAKPERTPVRVVVTDGTVVLTDPARGETTRLDGVSATVGVPKRRSEPVTVAVAAKAAGELKAEGEFGGGGKVKLVADGFDVAAVGPLLRRFDDTTTAGGRLTADAAVEWEGSGFAANGRARVTGLSLGGAWLNGDVLRLASVDLPVRLAYTDGKLTVEHASLTCDAGTASFAGTVNAAALDTVFDRAGLSLDADVDVAKVAALLPRLLRVRSGTELTGGRVIAKLSSVAGADGPTWAGSLNTTRLEARRNGRPVAWDRPLSVTFRGRVRKDGLPVFDDLVVVADFLTARAQGGPESFAVAVNLELDHLNAHLSDFLDLGGIKLGGSARNLIVRTKPKQGGGYTLTADGTVANLVVLDQDGKGIREPSLTLAVRADGDLVRGGEEARITGARVDSGTVNVTAGGDALDVKLVEPIADVKALASGRAEVNLTGDLARWRTRVGPLVGVPKGWDLGGTAKQASAVVALGEVVTARSVKLTVANAVFRGAGLDVAEPELKLETADREGGAVTFDRKTGAVALLFTTVTSDTIRGATTRFVIKPDAKGEYTASGKWGDVVARLDRVQRVLRLQTDPALADQLRGTAKGTVDLTTASASRVGFVANLRVDPFAFGPPAAPTWTEPTLTVNADGEYDLPTDTLTLGSAVVGRDGFTATGRGRVGKLSTAVELDLSGDLAYDLAKLEPHLKQYLGKSAAAAGKDTKPFRVAGNLLNGGQNLTVAVGGKPAGKADLTRLTGNAAVAWTSLRAYGFDVGQSELRATADKGVLTVTPVEAAFGGGKVRVQPTLRLNPGAYDLSFQKGKVIDAAKLTPAACAEAVGYALPALANSAQADGTVSFDLGDNRIPLADPARGTVKGTLTVHDATVSPGPVVTQLIEAFGLDAPKVHVTKGTAVPVRMENGRVYHSDFVVNVGNTPVTTAGSVGTDGTLDLTVSVPVGSTLAEKLVPGNRPVIQKALAQQTVTLAIGGTLGKPTLNREAMRGQLARLVQGVMRDAVKEAGGAVADDLIKKGLEGLFKKK
jgi:hypothetical protein